MHMHTPLFYGPLSGTTRVSQYQKKHSPTQSYLDYQPSLSPFSIYYNPWHIYFFCRFLLSYYITHTHTQPFYGSVEIVRDNPAEPVPEETFTHYTHRSHQSSLSAFSIYYDTWHPLYSIHLLYSLFPQSPSFLWSTSWPGTLHFILHTFLHPIIVFFSQHMPIPSQPVPL